MEAFSELTLTLTVRPRVKPWNPDGASCVWESHVTKMFATSALPRQICLHQLSGVKTTSSQRQEANQGRLFFFFLIEIAASAKKKKPSWIRTLETVACFLTTGCCYIFSNWAFKWLHLLSKTLHLILASPSILLSFTCTGGKRVWWQNCLITEMLNESASKI